MELVGGGGGKEPRWDGKREAGLCLTQVKLGLRGMGMKQVEQGVEEALIRERLRAENFRLNYEALKALHLRLRNQIQSVEPEILDLELTKDKRLDMYRNSSRDSVVINVAGTSASKAIQTIPFVEKNTVQELKIALETQPGNEELKALYLSILEQYKNYKDSTWDVMKRVTDEYDRMFEVMRDKFQSQLDLLATEVSDTSSENRKLKRENTRMKSDLDIMKAEMERVVSEMPEPGPSPKKSKTLDDFMVLDHSKCQFELAVSRKREEALTNELTCREATLEESIEKFNNERNEHAVEIRKLQTELDRSEFMQVQMKNNLDSKISEINSTLIDQVKHTKKLTKFVDEREKGYAEAKKELTEFVWGIINNSNELVTCLQQSVETSLKKSEQVQVYMKELERKANEYQDIPRKFSFLINSACQKVSETIIGCRLVMPHQEEKEADNESGHESVFENSQKRIAMMLQLVMRYKQEAINMINEGHIRIAEVECQLSQHARTNVKLMEKLGIHEKSIRDFKHAARKHRILLKFIQSEWINQLHQAALPVISSPSSNSSSDSPLSTDSFDTHESSVSNSPVPNSPIANSSGSNSPHPNSPVLIPPLLKSPATKKPVSKSPARNEQVAKSTVTKSPKSPARKEQVPKSSVTKSPKSPFYNPDEFNKELANKILGFGNLNQNLTAALQKMEVDECGDSGKPPGELIQHLKFSQVLFGPDPEVCLSKNAPK